MSQMIPEEPSERLPFERIGNYRLINKLGAGGMGEVYLGVEEPIGRKVAIKLMRPDLEKWFLQRFNDERKALASLNQRNIVVMLTSGEANHRHYLVMEYLEGESLAERLRRGSMAPSEILEITQQICDALNAAHRREIVHRDIKPDNIFLTHDDDGPLVKVLDFGIATLKESEARTMAGGVIGTGPYLSPEQSRGLSRREIDGRADIYALGMVVYEMLTGVRAFTAQDLRGYQYLHLHVMPPRPSERMHGTGSEAIDALVMKALAKDPSQRHQTAREFANELQAAFKRGSVPEPKKSPEDDRIQVSKAFVAGPPGWKLNEAVEKSPVSVAAHDARTVISRFHLRHPRTILLLAITSLFLLSGGGWWIYSRFISPGGATVVDVSSKGGLTNSSAGQSARSEETSQSPSPERTASPEVISPAGDPTIFKPATKVGGAGERNPIAGETNTRNSPVSPQKELQAADASSKPADASRLIGKWQSTVMESGIQTTIIWQVNRNGTTNYLFKNSQGSILTTGRWRYSNGV
ncbi:MAG TPA: serine/threonine-protein kinase, partial [Blastocatellia bacterium]|nr:serine/threonine-protein kinase [Blastocatellia bacterium]